MGCIALSEPGRGDLFGLRHLDSMGAIAKTLSVRVQCLPQECDRMAINWILALKAVPWTDLVQATPAIVKGARKLFTSGGSGAARQTTSTARPDPSVASTSAEVRLADLEAALDAVSREQQASAELIRSLAEQNARVVQTMTIIRARARILLIMFVALSIAFATFAIWVVTR
jgi:hypothetical protein